MSNAQSSEQRFVPLADIQDPDGAYIARWVHELERLPRKWLHQPWLAPSDVLKSAGVQFGTGPGCYPHRLTTEVLQVCAKHNTCPAVESFLSLYIHVLCCPHRITAAELQVGACFEHPCGVPKKFPVRLWSSLLCSWWIY